MKNSKTPGNSRLTKEFYKMFSDELKIPLIETVNQAFHTKAFTKTTINISQREAAIETNNM